MANALEFCANQCPQGNIQIAQEEKKTAKQSLRRLQVIEGREDAGIVAEHGHSQQRTCDDTVQLGAWGSEDAKTDTDISLQ